MLPKIGLMEIQDNCIEGGHVEVPSMNFKFIQIH